MKCEKCNKKDGEQYIGYSFYCDACRDELLEELESEAKSVVAKQKKKDNRMTVRLTESDLKMVDFIKSLYTDIKLEMTDSEVLRLALREIAHDRGFKDGSSG